MKGLQPILLDGEWREASAAPSTFARVSPVDGSALESRFPVCGWADLERAVKAGRVAALSLRGLDPERLGRFLETYAASIEARAGELVARAHAETALPQAWLAQTELAATVQQLRLAAQAARERTWRHAMIDTVNGVRTMRGSLDGPVIVMGPSSSPFALGSVCGSDFAAALAAGNPVIAKANPRHPGTAKLLAETARDALEKTKMPLGTVQLIYEVQLEDGLGWVAQRGVGAVAFAGSRVRGLAIKAAADRAGVPVHLQLPGMNPVCVLPGTLRERPDAVADDFVAALLTAHGQTCSKPGLVLLVRGIESERFLTTVSHKLEAATPGPLLGRTVVEDLDRTIVEGTSAGAVIFAGGRAMPGRDHRFQPTLLRIPGADFLRQADALQTPAVGPLALCVFAADDDELVQVCARLAGSAVASIYSHVGVVDNTLHERVASLLRGKAGRLLDDRMPTAAETSPIVVRGGPFPASGHAGFSAAGMVASMQRFSALHCYDRVRPYRLPEELRNRNPSGTMWRQIDGEWTLRDV